MMRQDSPPKMSYRVPRRTAVSRHDKTRASSTPVLPHGRANQRSRAYCTSCTSPPRCRAALRSCRPMPQRKIARQAIDGVGCRIDHRGRAKELLQLAGRGGGPPHPTSPIFPSAPRRRVILGAHELARAGEAIGG